MKRGEFLYPHAFTVAAAIYYHDNDATVSQIYKLLGDEGPARSSYYQILRSLCKSGYAEELRLDADGKQGIPLRWRLTPAGAGILGASASQYEFCLNIAVKIGQFVRDKGDDFSSVEDVVVK